MRHWVFGGLIVGVAIAVAPVAVIAGNGSVYPPTLSAGAIELGVDGAMTTTEGVTQGSVMIRGGWFFGAFGGLGGGEVSWGYRHVSALDATDVEATASWQKRFRHTSSYPFLSIGGGLRYEDIGSFSQTLYPFGFSVGVRSLLGHRGGFRVEYRFRRVFNDPSADFSEHNLVLGLSVFFRNPNAGTE